MIRSSRVLAWFAALAVMLSAGTLSCGESTGPDPLVDFTVDVFDLRNGPLPPVQSTVGSGTITVSGGFWTSCAALASEIEGAAAINGTEIELQVRWTGNPTGCVPAIDNFVYDAVLGGLSPGTYHVQVVHVPGSEAYAALDENVAVP